MCFIEIWLCNHDDVDILLIILHNGMKTRNEMTKGLLISKQLHSSENYLINYVHYQH